MAEEELTHTAGYPLDSRLSAQHEGTFGRVTLIERLPKVLTQIIDTVHKYEPTAVKQHGESGGEAARTVLKQLSELRYKMQTDKEMSSICSGQDTQLWKAAFDAYHNKLGTQPHWFSTSWLFFECYMYRKIAEILFNCELLRDFDPFRSQKENGLFSSLEAMSAVGDQLVKLIEGGQSKPVPNQAEFQHFLMLCLWGNKADLSMSATMDSYDTTHHTGSAGQTTQFILADHSQQLWELLSAQNDNRRLDIVLDNSGFELFCDLCFAEWLLSVNLVSRVVLHCKQLPWFISDATQHDVNWTIDQFISSSNPTLHFLGRRWKTRLEDGTFLLTDDPFWTSSYSYDAMKKVAADLYTFLSESKLALFKGDLNHRKLIGDRNWLYTKPFTDALQGFHPTNVCSLRTLKADLVAGLPAGAATRAAAECKDWMTTGKYGVILVSKIV